MRVAILGASRYNVPVIRHLRDTGFDVLAIDGNPAAPGLAEGTTFAVADIRSADALRDAVVKHGPVDGIVTLGEAAVRSSARVSAELGLPTISEEAAHNATSKIAMRRCWDAIPQYSIPWRRVAVEAEALAAAGEIGYPVIVKPDRTHGGSRGVTRADDPGELARAFVFARDNGMTPDVIVEQFIDSLAEYSTEVLIHEGETSVLAVGEKIKTRPPYRVDLSVRYPAVILNGKDEELSPVTAVADMCAKAVKAIGLTRGVAHIELAMTASGPRLLELGARCGGGHTPLLVHASSGVDEIAEVCRMACGLPPAEWTPSQRRGAEYRFLAFPPGTVDEPIVPDEVLEHPNVIDAGILGTRGTVLREIQTGADRAGFIATLGTTREEAVAVADWAMERIAIRYDDGRVRGALPIAELR